MKFIYTKHAEEKLQRPDVRGFGISKVQIESIIKSPKLRDKSTTGEYLAFGYLSGPYIIRIVYDKMDRGIKVITFHVAKRGRYNTPRE